MIEYTGFRFCPSCGSDHIEVHQKSAIRCTQCGYVYFHNTASAVAAIIEINGKILLTIRAHEPKVGMYDLPGGFVGYGETIETACVREIREELGIVVRIDSFLGTFANRYEYKGVSYFTTDIFFICRPVDASATIKLNDEITSWALFASKDIPFDKLGFDSNKGGLRYYVQQRGGL
jgi:NAD+ diphosphatase